MSQQTDDMLNNIAALEDRLADMKRANDEEDDGDFELAFEQSESLLRLLRAQLEAIAVGHQDQPPDEPPLPMPGD
jgi:hypothetical protein